MYVVVPPINAAMLAGLMGVLGERRHERQIDVDVRIDEAGKTSFPDASMTSASGGASSSCRFV